MGCNVNISNRKIKITMRITILNKRWKLVRRHTGPVADGHCDPPNAPHKQISVHSGLRGERELEVFIHEMMHAADWSKDEDWVRDLSQDMAKVLWRLGYRKS